MKYLAFLFLVVFFLVEEGYGRSTQFSSMSFGANSSYPSLSCYGEGDDDNNYDEDGDYYYGDSQEGKLPDENAINKTLYGSHRNSSNNYGEYDPYYSSNGHNDSNGPQVVVISLQSNSSNPSRSMSSTSGGGVNWQSLKLNVTELLKQLLGSGGSSSFSFRRTV